MAPSAEVDTTGTGATLIGTVRAPIVIAIRLAWIDPSDRFQPGEQAGYR